MMIIDEQAEYNQKLLSVIDITAVKIQNLVTVIKENDELTVLYAVRVEEFLTELNEMKTHINKK